jgi:hypothetical protein
MLKPLLMMVHHQYVHLLIVKALNDDYNHQPGVEQPLASLAGPAISIAEFDTLRIQLV